MKLIHLPTAVYAYSTLTVGWSKEASLASPNYKLCQKGKF